MSSVETYEHPFTITIKQVSDVLIATAAIGPVVMATESEGLGTSYSTLTQRVYAAAAANLHAVQAHTSGSVYLSRRNLETLLSKLDRRAGGETTAATLVKQDTVHPVYPQTFGRVNVVAVENDVYYTERAAGDVLAVDDPALR